MFDCKVGHKVKTVLVKQIHLFIKALEYCFIFGKCAKLLKNGILPLSFLRSGVYLLTCG